jgi:hypothetical protein
VANVANKNIYIARAFTQAYLMNMQINAASIFSLTRITQQASGQIANYLKTTYDHPEFKTRKLLKSKISVILSR